ncbi:calcium channel flower-like [Convolutriloba macropyga]|uniref:calcium channel flower-like n=1 Tax=Convolutriloba macropyga TaxID=536237 RepID=UPI003F525029
MPDVESNQKPAEQSANEVTWGFKILGRVIGTLAAAAMIILGLMTMIGFSGSCLLSGVLMMIFGGLVIMIEAPIFCQYFQWAEKVTQFVDNRPYFLRAGLYLILSIVPFAICRSVSSFFGCGALFVAGTFYGVIAVGKKGDAVKAATAAHGGGGYQPQVNNDESTLR